MSQTMNRLVLKTIVFLMIVFSISAFSQSSNAGLLFNYHQLALKDLDQMNEIVKSKIKESRKSSSGKVVPLKEALQAIYSRPNEDGMIEKVSGPLRSELDENDAWYTTLEQLVNEASSCLKNPKAFKADVQVTYAIFLNNIIAESKPMLSEDKAIRKLFEKIEAANIEITKEAKAERNLRMMKELPSPSELAKRILNPVVVAPEANQQDK